jgi:hypothetical protein
MRLVGRGLPAFGGRRGNRCVQVEIPQPLSHEQRALYERLRALALERHRA